MGSMVPNGELTKATEWQTEGSMRALALTMYQQKKNAAFGFYTA